MRCTDCAFAGTGTAKTANAAQSVIAMADVRNVIAIVIPDLFEFSWTIYRRMPGRFNGLPGSVGPCRCGYLSQSLENHAEKYCICRLDIPVAGKGSGVIDPKIEAVVFVIQKGAMAKRPAAAGQVAPRIGPEAPALGYPGGETERYLLAISKFILRVENVGQFLLVDRQVVNVKTQGIDANPALHLVSAR